MVLSLVKQIFPLCSFGPFQPLFFWTIQREIVFFHTINLIPLVSKSKLQVLTIEMSLWERVFQSLSSFFLIFSIFIISFPNRKFNLTFGTRNIALVIGIGQLKQQADHEIEIHQAYPSDSEFSLEMGLLSIEERQGSDIKSASIRCLLN